MTENTYCVYRHTFPNGKVYNCISVFERRIRINRPSITGWAGKADRGCFFKGVVPVLW